MITVLAASVQVTRLLWAASSPVATSIPVPATRGIDDVAPTPSFVADLSAAAKQDGLAVLVEGVPGKKRTVDAPPHGDTAGDPNAVPEDLQRIAAAYDYTARRTGSHVVVFEKRFTDPAELPDISRAEALADLKALNTEINGLISSEPFDHILSDLYQALPAEGRAVAAHGVAYSSLPPDLQIRVREFALSSYLEFTPRFLSNVERRLKAFGGNSCSLSHGQYWHEELPVVSGPFGIDDANWDFVLGGWVITQPGGSSGVDGVKGVDVVDDRIVSKMADPTLPDLSAPEATEPDKTDGVSSLGQVMDTLSSRSTSDRFTASPAVAAKRVILVQADSANPVDIAGAAAKLFGLRLRVQQDHSYLLACPETRDIQNVDELGKECQRLLPAAYQRFVTAHEWHPLYYAAVKRARTLVEPRLTAGHAISLADAGPEFADRIALAGLATCQDSFDIMERPFPAYMSHLDSALFTIKQDPTDPNHMLQYSFDYDEPHAPGAPHSGSALAGAIAVPQ